MTILYQPPVANLGIMAPVLGPWFDGGAAMPAIPALAGAGATPTQLHVPIAFNNNSWLPPATGNLSLFFIQNNAVPPALDTLRNIDGINPFAAGGVYGGTTRLVAYFRLLPEVEERLHQCVGMIPSATAAPLGAAAPAVNVPTRPQVRSFMMVFPANAVIPVNFIIAIFNNNLDGDDAFERMNSVGLVTDGVNITGNMALPMAHLRRPGGLSPDTLLDNLTGAYDLWCFDRRGRPVDPGAVACWWSWLLNYGIGETAAGNGQFQLMAPGVGPGDLATPGAVLALPPAATPPASVPHIANFAPGLTAHLVSPHEGVLGAPFVVLSGDTADTNNVIRLTINASGAAVTPAAATPLVSATPAIGNIVFGFTAPPAASFPAPAAGAPTVPFNPPVDNAPLARIAVLPNGSYGAAATLWPGGPLHTNLTRDFVRVAVLDEEVFLAGVARRRSELGAPTPAFTDAAGKLPIQLRREMDQNRPSTRISVAASNGPVLRASSSAVAGALLALPSGANNPARLILGVTDTAWGGPSAPAGQAVAAPAAALPFPANLTDFGNGAPQTPLPPGQYRVLPLQGDGGLANDRQMVLVEINFAGSPGACAGSTVRVWPLGLTFGTGDHFRLSGGAARACANNMAYVVMTLADGLANPVGQMHMDILVTIPDTSGGTLHRRYASRPFVRPAPINGAAVNGLPAAPWAVCESGASALAGALPNGAVPAGAHVVQLGTPRALVDRTTIPAANWVGTLANYLTANPTALVSLTEPAFMSTCDRADAVGRALPKEVVNTPGSGNVAPGFNGPGGGVAGLIGTAQMHLLGRAIEDSASASLPFGLMDRKEVVGASFAGPGQAAVIGSAPPVPWGMEPATNHFLAYPGVPASIEVHGAGATLSGGAAIAAGEYVRERTAGLAIVAFQNIVDVHLRSMVFQSEVALVAEAAATALPVAVAPAGPSPVVAVLRTSAVGVEGLPLFGSSMLSQGYYPTMTNVLDTFYTWANGAINLPGPAFPGKPPPGQFGTWLSNQNPPANNALAACRALDRRIQSAVYGSREGLNSLLAAINRAEDLIYIETPELDNLAIRSGDGIAQNDENINLWQALLNRMSNRIGLRVVLCVSTLPMPGTPEKMRMVRDQCLLDALTAARAAHGSRFVVFSPGVGGGRSLRLASTSVVIDDAYALTGTTHLSRRGLSWDSSLAVAVFDENLTDGRPSDVRNFRNQLMADRLGIPLAAVPIDAVELVRAITDLDARGSSRLSASPIVPPNATISNVDRDVWNPDGSQSSAELNSLPGYAALFATTVAETGVGHAMVEG